MKQHYFITIGIISTLLFLGCTGCNKKNDDPFSAMNFDSYDTGLNKRVEAYQDATFPNLANTKTGNPSLYIDFSNGIFQAFKNNPTNSNLLKAVYGNLSGDLDVFMLNNDVIKPLENSNPDLVGKMVVDQNSYHGVYAPIKEAVSKIVSKNNDALLVTDFEEYYPASSGRSEILDIPYLKESFIIWLSKGNTIRFYVSNYKENGIDKHLYFTVFNCGNSSKSGMISKVENSLGSLPHFDLSNKSFKLNQEYGAEKTGGIFYDSSGKDEKGKNLLDLNRDTYVNGLQNNNNFEFYQFGLDWATINELKEVYQEQNQFKDFFRKLFIDLSDEDAYSIADLEVKVYDVSKDFEHFAKCKEVLKHKPKLEKGSNGEDKFKDGQIDNIALSCYDTKGKVIEDWVYKSNPNLILAEVFSLNKELFVNTKKSNKKKVELGVSFDSNFNLKNISNPTGLIRVDLVINNANPNISNSKLDMFKWSSITSKGNQNLALYESIKNTLLDEKVKPSNKVIYSYYIKTL
ncbi:hypothetical protein [Flavobacterium sp. K5-23]|uniref:hypothetical protein n=1 Tax=Flavobacterium sp. K5-23 TaxID=2746225 RepID=UPI00200FDCB5|nr:hypothetical protein [Flavobacterium sp. K5-23]UQD57224.1 hypothetical protein FLAK523_12805 [Flavobacterium sp. K5-23]